MWGYPCHLAVTPLAHSPRTSVILEILANCADLCEVHTTSHFLLLIWLIWFKMLAYFSVDVLPKTRKFDSCAKSRNNQEHVYEACWKYGSQDISRILKAFWVSMRGSECAEWTRWEERSRSGFSSDEVSFVRMHQCRVLIHCFTYLYGFIQIPWHTMTVYILKRLLKTFK